MLSNECVEKRRLYVSANGGRWTGRGALEGRGGQCRAPGLPAAREAAGMTLEEPTERTGYGIGLLGSIEEGQMVHRMAVSRIAGVLGADPARPQRPDPGALCPRRAAPRVPFVAKPPWGCFPGLFPKKRFRAAFVGSRRAQTASVGLPRAAEG
jgi:hypothetical protein